jgi:hypothetical protein
MKMFRWPLASLMRREARRRWPSRQLHCTVPKPCGYQYGRNQDIFHREFEAMMRGIAEGNESCQHRWYWLTDNTRSIYQLRKTWAAEWFLNEAVERWHALQRRNRSTIAYVPSRSMLLDAFTRAGVPREERAPACHLPGHAGTACPEFTVWVQSFVPSAAIPVDGLSGFRTVRYALAESRIRFSEHAPPAALQPTQKRWPPDGAGRSAMRRTRRPT